MIICRSGASRDFEGPNSKRAVSRGRVPDAEDETGPGSLSSSCNQRPARVEGEYAVCKADSPQSLLATEGWRDDPMGSLCCFLILSSSSAFPLFIHSPHVHSLPTFSSLVIRADMH